MAAVAGVVPLTKTEIATTSFLTSSSTIWILGILFVVAAIVLVAVLYVPNDKNVVLTKGIPSSLTLSEHADTIVPEKMPLAVHENLKVYKNDLAMPKDSLSHGQASNVQIVENGKHV